MTHTIIRSVIDLFLRIWKERASRNRAIAVATLLFFVLSFRLIALHQPPSYYFDEIYHGYTAVQYTHQNPDAYDPWGKAAPGFANEWSHPPLAKLFMAVGVAAFGEYSWAWRVASAIFGTISVGLVGLFAYQLTGKYRVSILSMTLMSFEGLHLVMSRIAMNDIFFVTFILATFCAYWHAQLTQSKTPFNRWFLFSGILLGAALASKWTALYAFGIIGLDQLVRWLWIEKRIPNPQEFVFKAFAFGVLPVATYLASYIHMFSLGFDWAFFTELQRQMWWYHTNLTATHGYQSQPWQWLLDLRPVWMSAQYSETGVANIYALGNPLLLWAGLVAVSAAFWNQLGRWDHGRWFLLLAYFAFWVPWLFSPRIMFFYHYFPSIIFLVLLLAISIDEWVFSGIGKVRTERKLYLIAFLSLAALWLAAFSPHLLGIEVPTLWSEKLFIFESWR